MRSGQHIQEQYRGQEDLFRFLSKHVTGLTQYYERLFGLSLKAFGSVNGTYYYYLDIIDGTKNRVPDDLRRTLKKEHILIGIFLCKLEIDFSEVDTVSGFKRALREDYETYKKDFFRLLAQVTDDDYIDSDEQRIDKKIESAFNEFHHLGWVYRDGDNFEIMPSLERLRMLYVNEINNIDEFLVYE